MKTILKRISAGALAAVFLATFAVPRSRAVTGVDDTTLGIMAVIVHLQSIGGELAVTQGTALATTDAVTSLATQAGAAGALGAGVTGATALATIGAAVTAFAGGYTIGYAGYETLSKLAEWIRQSKLTGTAENTIYISGGAWDKLADGKPIINSNSHPDGYVQGQIYTTEAGSAFRVTTVDTGEKNENGAELYKSTMVAVDVDNKMHVYESGKFTTSSGPDDSSPYYIAWTTVDNVGIQSWYNSPYATRIPNTKPETGYAWGRVFGDPGGEPVEKREVIYTPPATWSPPAPALGQDVLYQPYPNQPDKPLTDIAQDVPKDIYDKQLKPLPPTVVTPTTPPVTPPDIPPVNPNPDVETPEDVTPYKVKIGEVFPFCIPFDLYHMVTMFSADPEAPHAKWTFSLPWSPAQEYKVEWDLKKFDDLAELCRKLELVLFCVGLAVVTSKLIKW